MKYFSGVRTFEEANQRFRDLAKQLHPDTNGNAEQFKEMKQEYDEIKIALKYLPQFTTTKPEKPKKVKVVAEAVEPIRQTTIIVNVNQPKQVSVADIEEFFTGAVKIAKSAKPLIDFLESL